jgi:YebC/PmpR family DNA-binding regulatory protein
MAGHNKWSKVKHRKEAVDAKKGKIFSDLAKDIALASREVGGDASSPRLRTLIDKARGVNMPNENIERAIAKGTGAGGGEREKIVYEIYGPAGVAFIIETETDSTNRTVAELKQILAKHSLELAAPGSALWAFTKNETGFVPHTTIPVSPAEDETIQKIISAISQQADVINITTNKGV